MSGQHHTHAVRVSLPQQIEAMAEAVSGQQMLIDSGRAKLGAAAARYQLERLKAVRGTLAALQPVADILRAVLRMDAARLATLRELLARWEAEQTGAPPAERLDGGEAGGETETEADHG